MRTYGFSIIWGKNSVFVDGLPTHHEAVSAAVYAASLMGWEPPRWWQFWRISDTRVPMGQLLAALRGYREAEIGMMVQPS